jgi:hypothetical protein
MQASGLATAATVATTVATTAPAPRRQSAGAAAAAAVREASRAGHGSSSGGGGGELPLPCSPPREREHPVRALRSPVVGIPMATYSIPRGCLHVPMPWGGRVLSS